MKWAVCFVLAAACQSGQSTESSSGAPAGSAAGSKIVQLPKAQVTEQYRADITTLCDVVHLSGADEKPKGERWSMVAVFLGTQIKTAEADEFIRALKPLPPDAYALALDTEAKRVGLPKCELANEWRAVASGG
jgi:hypothetical protein